MAGRKSDFVLPTLDDLFSTQEQREEAKLARIRDIPIELIDSFPDHPSMTLLHGFLMWPLNGLSGICPYCRQW